LIEAEEDVPRNAGFLGQQGDLAQRLVITPNMVLVADLPVRESSPSPTYIAERPSAASSG